MYHNFRKFSWWTVKKIKSFCTFSSVHSFRLEFILGAKDKNSPFPEKETI